MLARVQGGARSLIAPIRDQQTHRVAQPGRLKPDRRVVVLLPLLCWHSWL